MTSTDDRSETATAVDPGENSKEIREYIIGLPEKELLKLLDDYAAENKDFSN